MGHVPFMLPHQPGQTGQGQLGVTTINTVGIIYSVWWVPCTSLSPQQDAVNCQVRQLSKPNHTRGESPPKMQLCICSTCRANLQKRTKPKVSLTDLRSMQHSCIAVAAICSIQGYNFPGRGSESQDQQSMLQPIQQACLVCSCSAWESTQQE